MDDSTRPQYKNPKMFRIKVEYPDCSSLDSDSDKEQGKSKKNRNAASSATSTDRKRKSICESTKKNKGIHICHLCQKDFTVQEMSNHLATDLDS